MSGFPVSMKALIEEFAKMPGIGPKSAQRLAFYILRAPKSDADALSKAIGKVKESVRFCKACNNLSDEEVCDICKSKTRDRSLLCVVEEPNDIIAIERAKEYKGIYHVLLGSLSPLDGIGPSDLKIKELLERVKKEKFNEIIIATDFNTEGEATALYLTKQLKDSGARLTRVAYGIPVGSDIEYADQATILKAFEGRRDLQRA
ncbi:MAG: recombination mediator RecR [Candidatus Omnitrophota bacterium]|nr:recombination mediator RecR [Candidatus Omnitrophota bacterium]